MPEYNVKSPSDAEDALLAVKKFFDTKDGSDYADGYNLAFTESCTDILSDLPGYINVFYQDQQDNLPSEEDEEEVDDKKDA